MQWISYYADERPLKLLFHTEILHAAKSIHEEIVLIYPLKVPGDLDLAISRFIEFERKPWKGSKLILLLKSSWKMKIKTNLLRKMIFRVHCIDKLHLCLRVVLGLKKDPPQCLWWCFVPWGIVSLLFSNLKNVSQFHKSHHGVEKQCNEFLVMLMKGTIKTTFLKLKSPVQVGTEHKSILNDFDEAAIFVN